jgi:tRNA threonylcarbamoyladenosine biosynthesis protein TsaE
MDMSGLSHSLGSPAETEAAGAQLASLIKPGDVIALFGDLGAGKTTLTRGLLRGLGHRGDVASPTFPIVQTYDELEPPLWHVDLYRVEAPEELEELGLDDALADTALVIEWPERLGAALWPHALRLHLTGAGEGPRTLTAQVPPAWEGRWSPR